MSEGDPQNPNAGGGLPELASGRRDATWSSTKALALHASGKCSHYTVEELRIEALQPGRSRANQIELRGRCLQGELFQAEDDLSSVNFAGSNLSFARLSGCVLTGLPFRDATMQETVLRAADLRGADLSGADLTNSRLEDADLRGADLLRAHLQGANLTQVKLRRTRLRREALGNALKQDTAPERDYIGARDIYLSLKENFQSLGAYDAASWAYFRERQAERKSYSPRNVWNNHPGELDQDRHFETASFRLRMRLLAKWVLAWIQELIWGYSQRPFNVIILSAAILLGFSLVYRAIDGLTTKSNDPPTLVQTLLYSFAAFTTSGLDGIQPRWDSVQLLSSVEGFLGITTLALFATCLAYRMGGR